MEVEIKHPGLFKRIVKAPLVFIKHYGILVGNGNPKIVAIKLAAQLTWLLFKKIKTTKESEKDDHNGS